MEPLIIFGGTIFWIIFAIFAVAMIASVEYDNGWMATIITAVMIVIIMWGVEFNVFAWVWDNPSTAIYYFVGYFVAGAVWGVSKWWFYCRKFLDVVKGIKVEFLNSNNISDDKIPENMKDKFEKEVVSNYNYNDSYYPPQAMDHKSDWLMWAMWWPFSFFWTMLNQPIKNLWLFIYSHLGGLMQKISDSVFKGV